MQLTTNIKSQFTYALPHYIPTLQISHTSLYHRTTYLHFYTLSAQTEPSRHNISEFPFSLVELLEANAY